MLPLKSFSMVKLFESVILLRVVAKLTPRTWTFQPWMELWDDRASSLYANTYENGWLLVTIVRCFMLCSLFSLFSCYYLVIHDLSALGRALSDLLRAL